ncbi:STAS/SEC14 domain-containing protein [Mycobacterium ostraviense]
MKFGLRHFFIWERGALVTDLTWMRRAAKFYDCLGFPIPGGFRAFPTAEAAKARDWIGERQG